MPLPVRTKKKTPLLQKKDEKDDIKQVFDTYKDYMGVDGILMGTFLRGRRS